MIELIIWKAKYQVGLIVVDNTELPTTAAID